MENEREKRKREMAGGMYYLRVVYSTKGKRRADKRNNKHEKNTGSGARHLL